MYLLNINSENTLCYNYQQCFRLKRPRSSRAHTTAKTFFRILSIQRAPKRSSLESFEESKKNFSDERSFRPEKAAAATAA
jgi:hypothetical protein